jgi:hypothetical protein
MLAATGTCRNAVAARPALWAFEAVSIGRVF